TGLLVVGYTDVVDAARDVPAILRHRPTAVEGIDEVIVSTMRSRRGDDAVADLPAGRAWLFIELDDEGGSARTPRSTSGSRCSPASSPPPGTPWRRWRSPTPAPAPTSGGSARTAPA